MPPACSLTRSLRARSCGGRSCSPAPSVLGSAASRSVPLATSRTHRQVTGSLPPWVRRKTTRVPSGETRNARGTPSVNRLVLASCRGKLSVMGKILPFTSHPGAADRLPGMSSADDHKVPRPERRLLLVHAHPDDESIGTGATMAKYAAEGAQVTLVTCTLGELGEIIPPALAHLAADREDRLGEYRIGELDAACATLGVTDHRFLGGPGRWRDSGMMGTEGNDDPRCFWQADVDEVARALLDVIDEVRPQVLLTYDAEGAYGHPDHLQAHRVGWRACELAGPDA